MERLYAEKEAARFDKITSYLRGYIVRYNFARQAVHEYVGKRILDPFTGRRKRVYVNTKTGVVLRRRPRFLKAFNMEPKKQEEIDAAKLLQNAVRVRQAHVEAERIAKNVYEECFDEEEQRSYW
jgi:hypothetical protein